jgi:hypothetical protein
MMDVQANIELSAFPMQRSINNVAHGRLLDTADDGSMDVAAANSMNETKRG